MSAGRVLVVDDTVENRALAQATLEDESYVVELATSGEQAIAAFTREQPDCVLLDIRMPGMNGIDACMRIRALPGGADVPILFLTAQRDVETFDRARDAGGDDFITKPVRPTELVTRVANAMRLRRMTMERGALYEQTRRQRDDLMRLQLQKEQLMEFLVHDLKNPVNAIELHGQRILRDGDASPKVRDAATKIHDESTALLRMITNLLDLSKADEGRLAPSLQSCALGALIAEVIEAMTVRAHAVATRLESAVTVVTVRADPELLRRVVENLVDNAIRHAPEDTLIAVSATSRDGGVLLRVADAGTGVTPELRERVFERFVQGGSGRSNRGLGLAFCKLAVEAHHGRIWIEDAAPGAAFCVWIPDD
ncbi:MAG: hybrid sensor histidine kinase/response regulator [Kofleriaceae bacterium]